MTLQEALKVLGIEATDTKEVVSNAYFRKMESLKKCRDNGVQKDIVDGIFKRLSIALATIFEFDNDKSKGIQGLSDNCSISELRVILQRKLVDFFYLPQEKLLTYVENQPMISKLRVLQNVALGFARKMNTIDSKCTINEFYLNALAYFNKVCGEIQDMYYQKYGVISGEVVTGSTLEEFLDNLDDVILRSTTRSGVK